MVSSSLDIAALAPITTNSSSFHYTLRTEPHSLLMRSEHHHHHHHPPFFNCSPILLTWLGIGSHGYCGQLPKKQTRGAGSGKPERCLPPWQHRSPQGPCCTQPHIPGLLPLASCSRSRGCYRNTSRTHWAEIKHPCWMETQPGSACRLGRHGNVPRRAGVGILTPWRGSGRPGAAARLAVLLPSAGAERSGRAAPRARWSREPSLLPARTPSSPGGLKVKARARSAPSLRVRREAIG